MKMGGAGIAPAALRIVDAMNMAWTAMAAPARLRPVQSRQTIF
jgi:hypothetical protein